MLVGVIGDLDVVIPSLTMMIVIPPASHLANIVKSSHRATSDH